MRRSYLTIIFLLLAVIATACNETQASSTPIPSIPIATNAPDEVEITEFSATPLNENQVAINACTKGRSGLGITLRVSFNTSPSGDETGQWQVVKELGVPCFNTSDRPVWNIGELEPGRYLIRVEAKTEEDPNWENPTSKTLVYEVK